MTARGMTMKRWLAILLALSIIGLAGCTKPIEFTGKSDNWSVDCTISPSAKEKAFTIRYIGSESPAVTQVYYAFKNSNNFDSQGKSDELAKHLTMSGKSTLVAPYREEDHFNLHVQWNGKEETIAVSKK